MENAIDITSL